MCIDSMRITVSDTETDHSNATWQPLQQPQDATEISGLGARISEIWADI